VLTKCEVIKVNPALLQPDYQDSAGKNQVINANVPMAEFLAYAPDLRSMTGGRGMYSMEFSHYDEVPAQISEKLIEEINKSKE